MFYDDFINIYKRLKIRVVNVQKVIAVPRSGIKSLDLYIKYNINYIKYIMLSIILTKHNDELYRIETAAWKSQHKSVATN